MGGKAARAAFLATVLAIGVGGIAHAAARTAPAPTGVWQRLPTNDDLALLALANMARSQPSLDGRGNEPAVTPMVWSGELAGAARFHSDDMAAHGCYQHDSCNGEKWSARVSRFYDTKGVSYGENINFGWNAREINNSWLASPLHRANILNGSFQQFGAAMSWGTDGFGPLTLDTEDFGGVLVSPPVIPAGAVIAPANTTQSTLQWELLVNYFSATSDPVAVKAFVDGAQQTLTQASGTARNGSWRAMFTTHGDATTFCKNVYFQVTNANGTYRYPPVGTLPLGTAPGCADRPIDDGVSAPVTGLDRLHEGQILKGSVKLDAYAFSAEGLQSTAIYVDDKLFATGRFSAVKTWNTRAKAVTAGPHTISVQACDDVGRQSTAAITVTVVK